jgi:hypothetical protein
MTTRARDVDDLVARFRRFVELLIERDQARIGVHEDVTEAQQDLRDALKRVLGTKVEESAHD